MVDESDDFSLFLDTELVSEVHHTQIFLKNIMLCFGEHHLDAVDGSSERELGRKGMEILYYSGQVQFSTAQLMFCWADQNHAFYITLNRMAFPLFAITSVQKAVYGLDESLATKLKVLFNLGLSTIFGKNERGVNVKQTLWDLVIHSASYISTKRH